MLRAVVLVGVLGLFPAVASAQQPCTTDARRVVDEIYRQVLERSAGNSNPGMVDRLASGQATVRDLMREVAGSTEHIERFLQGNDTTQAARYLSA